MRSRWVPASSPGRAAGLPALAARGQRRQHLGEHGPSGQRGRAEDERDAAHRPVSPPSGRRRDQPRAVADAGPQAHVPGLALVDHVDVPDRLPVQQHLLQGAMRPEPAEPRHLDVGRVADAVRAGQQGGVAEGAQPALVLDAAGQAGDPQRRRAARRQRSANCAAIWFSSATAAGAAPGPATRPRSSARGRAARAARPSGRPGRRATRPGAGSGTAAGRPPGARRGPAGPELPSTSASVG